jgi:hypothetical protein
MPKTLVKSAEGQQIIGGAFSKPENADKAVTAFRELGVPNENIGIVFEPNQKELKKAYKEDFTNRGFSSKQADYYDKAVRDGKTLVVIYDVAEPGPIIDIFDKYNAEFNPDGSRNAREDVSGMTAGAVIGAAAGGAIGSLVGGPIGLAAGAAAGIAVGGSVGAAAGKAAEHNK